MHDGIFFHILIEVGVEIVPTHFLAYIVIINDFMGGGPQRPPHQSWLCKKSPVWVRLTMEYYIHGAVTIPQEGQFIGLCFS